MLLASEVDCQTGDRVCFYALFNGVEGAFHGTIAAINRSWITFKYVRPKGDAAMLEASHTLHLPLPRTAVRILHNVEPF